MSALPWIDWDDAERVGLELVTAGPKVRRAEREQIVTELRGAAGRAAELITTASGLPEVGTSRELVVDRATILRANVATARQLMSELGAAPAGPLSRAAGHVRGGTVGGVLAMVASRILGQYDPFGPDPALYLVAPTIMGVERQLKANPSDFRMWVVLHEQTHRVQFANAPWLRSHLVGQISGLLDASDEPAWRDLGARLEQLRRDKADGRPTSLRVMNAVSSPGTIAAMDRISATMSLLEGHADVMMDRAGRKVINSLPSIRAKFDARRARGGIFSLVNKLLGMDAKLAQYADGAKFCRHVVRAGGVSLLNRAFVGPEQLPTMAEILAPAQWCERVGRDGQA